MNGKVGVLTFHKSINYGSYWQARCLVEGLRSRGDDAELLDHDCPTIRLAELRCSLQPKLPERTPRSKLGHYKRKTRKFFEAWRHLPLSESFSLHAPEEGRRYERIIIGSDEVWNFRHPWYSHKPIFYGEGLNGERLISYAASFGSHDADDGVDADWARKLRRFSSVSVRDHNSQQLVRQALGFDPPLVLDPCFQFPEVIPTTSARTQEAFAVVYGHGFPEWLQVRVRSWADARGVKLLSVGYDNPWADEQALSEGPIEFAQLMAGASAVITNFFHGCVFALLRGKPLVTAAMPYRFNKIRDLAASFDIRHCIVDEQSSQGSIDRLLETPQGAAFERRLNELRAESNAFLDRAIA